MLIFHLAHTSSFPITKKTASSALKKKGGGVWFVGGGVGGGRKGEQHLATPERSSFFSCK